MKTTLKTSVLIMVMLGLFSLNAQNRNLDNYRQPDKRGINVFEAPKDSVSTFESVKVKLGGK